VDKKYSILKLVLNESKADGSNHQTKGVIMKKFSWIYSLLLIAAGVAFAEEKCAGGVCPLPVAKDKTAKVSTTELSNLISSGAVTVIDARPGAPMGLPGAKSLTGKPTAEEAAKVIPSKDSPVVTYCGGVTCPLSPMLAKHLESLGYTNVREYPEGFSGWQAAGKPVTALK
jgi:rhodanese-related sulfurtransferase